LIKFLFAKYYLSLRENIVFGDIKKVNDHLINEVLKKAKAEELLKQEKGLDQILG